jgi:hypothetical protein
LTRRLNQHFSHHHSLREPVRTFWIVILFISCPWEQRRIRPV